MKKWIYIAPLLVAAVAGWYGCKKLYNPKIVSGNSNYLVVEGVINTGNDSTIFNISRTVKVSSRRDSVAELGAVVNVEGDNNSSYVVTDLSGGRYGAPALGLDTTHKYRIHIHTSDGNEYVSDFTQAKYTPPIDSLGYLVQGNGVQLYVNTHDPKNNTRYYRWDYQETWQFHAEYISLWETNGTAVVPRPYNKLIYYCFASDSSSSITLGSSAKLAQDVIYQQPVIFIPSTSEKIEMKYSILLRQYSLTTDAFNYWQNLKKNSQDIGSIFDTQPSEVTGNIHCVTNPAQPVIGYISAGNIQQKRIFIANPQLPQTWVPTYPYACELDTVLYCAGLSCVNQVASALIPVPPQAIPVDAIFASGFTLGFYATTRPCVDCTIRGTQIQPAFWQ